MSFWKFQNSAEPDTIDLRIDGEIVDEEDVWIYEWFGEPCKSPNRFRDEMAKLGGKSLNVWIDSYGGNVYAGAGIYNALRNYPRHVTTIVDGKAMSAASVIAMAGNTVKMSPVGIMMIHNPLTRVSGYARELRKAADVLDVVKETILNAYTLKTGIAHDELSRMMEDETYMSAGEARRRGFVDDILNVEQDKLDAVNISFARFPVLNACGEREQKAIEAMMEHWKAAGAGAQGGISLPEAAGNGDESQPVADTETPQERRKNLNRLRLKIVEGIE